MHQGAPFQFFIEAFHPFLRCRLYAVVNVVYISLVQAQSFLLAD